MAVDITRLHYKGTGGVNRGWRRSRLGGGSGSHFYAWWAPFGAAPVKGELPFEAAPKDAVFFRDIRHHDDHTPLGCGDLATDYLPLSVSDLRASEYVPEPWTASQGRFARSRSLARILKGHPGSGKTTALLHAADASQAEHVLYLTFSKDLAALARDFFDRFCSDSRAFTVSTYPTFLTQLLGTERSVPHSDADAVAARVQFSRDLQHQHSSLGAWSTGLDALYDEIRAHLVGAAMPEQCGRFAKAERICLPEKAYLAQRNRSLGSAANSVIEAARRLEKGGGTLTDRYYPELALAWRAAQSLERHGEELAVFRDVGCIAIDEVQDLTPVEFFVVLKLAQQLNQDGRHVPLLVAGDEAQTRRERPVPVVSD